MTPVTPSPRDSPPPATRAALSRSWRPLHADRLPRSELRERLLPAWAPVAPWMWLLPLLPVVLGGVMRFWQLARPQEIAFDETYYVKDSWALVLSGYEQSWPEEADAGFSAGHPPDPTGDASFVVHPPVGKWLIGVGMLLFGPGDAFGWRFFPAVAGTVMIALVVLAALLMFRSPVVAAVAGTLLAVDGLHLTHSRLALLDIFLALFVLLAFVFLLLDRFDGRRRLIDRLPDPGRPDGDTTPMGPWLGVRWWRIAAGVSCGLAVGVKWNALYFVATLGIITVLWDLGARRAAGVRHWFPAGVLKDGLFAFVCMIPVALVTYVATWAGWLRTSGGYDRQWAAEHPGEGAQWLPGALRSLWEYHRAAYEFHVQLDSGHTYMAGPAQWPILGRPTSYFYESLQQGQNGCEVPNCSQAILNLGNPVIWWTAIPVMIALLILALTWRRWRMDWRILSPLALVAVGWLPWFAYPERTQFFFYALPYLPFMILLLAAGLCMILPGRESPGQASSKAYRIASWSVVGVWLALVLAVAWYFWPIWTAQVIPYEAWHRRMWFPSWI